MKYLIIGDGYVGNYLHRHLPNATLIKNKLGDPRQLKALLHDGYPSHTLINCAGKTGRPNIDWCESKKDVTFGANVGLPIMLAEVCQELKQYWVHVGSGCIYDGYEIEWTEDDDPNFFESFYSKTKAWSQYMLEGYDEPLIIRMRMPIDEDLEPRCYIRKVVEYARAGQSIYDMPNSMTILSDLAKAIIHLTENGDIGTYNVVNQGSAKISDILSLYKEHVDPTLEYTVEDYDEIRKRLKTGRSNCLLSTAKLEGSGYRMPDLMPGIERILKAYGSKQSGSDMPKRS